MNDSGPGSLRSAFQQNTANRIIVFDVAGTIQLTSGSLAIKNLANYYIAGQTAPGPVTVYGDSTSITHSADTDNTNIILRYMSFRKGVGNGEDSLTFAGGNLPDETGRGRHLMVDHVSVSWAEDENLSVANNNTDVTVQHSLIADALGGGHAYGSLIRPRSDSSVTFHHNLYANNLSRQPRLGTYNAERLTADIRNNVVYNWGSRATYAGGSSEPEREYVDVNYVGNYLIAGPATASNATRAFIVDRNVDVQAFQQGNLIDSDRQLNPGGVPNGTDTGWGMFQVSSSTPQGTLIQRSSAVATAPVAAQSALDAYLGVISHAGNSRWGRDAVDTRIIDNVVSNTQPSNGVGATGPIASELNDLLTAPEIQHPLDWDTDADAMPDWWERQHGLDPASSADWNLDFDADGYINLIEYINEAGEFPAPAPIIFTGAENSRFAEIGNWDIHWQPSRLDEAQINNGPAIVDAVGQRARVLKLGANPGDNARLQVTDGWLAVSEEVVIGADSAATAVLELSGGSLSTPLVSLGAGGSLDFRGGQLRADHVDFDLLNQGGTLTPGLTTRTLTIAGSYDHAATASVIRLEIQGPAKGVDYDVLNVLGELMIAAGSLEVSLTNGYLPTPGDAFDLMDFSAFSGQFDSLFLPGGSSVWNKSQLFTQGILTYVGALAGDFNQDGVFDCQDIDALVADIAGGHQTPSFDVNADGLVDGRDLSQWLINAGAINLVGGNAYLVGDANLDGLVDGSDFNAWNTGKFTAALGWCGGDFNADGVTDGSDFGLWNSHKFQSSGASHPVPEPEGWVLLSLCWLLWTTRIVGPRRG